MLKPVDSLSKGGENRAVEYPEEGALNIYTDGSMLPSPRRAGGGIVFVLADDEGNEQIEEVTLPGYADTTQNQMELEAPIQALKLATGRRPPFEPSSYRKIVIKTDATYVSENFPVAVSVWSKNGWKMRAGRPVDNATQWKELVRLVALASRQGKPVRIVRVPGKRSPPTKRADKLAKQSAKAPPGLRRKPLVPAETRRKRTTAPISEIGTVPMTGQVMAIDIFKTQYQEVSRLTKYWYSVASDESPHYGVASTIYSKLHHFRRHRYLVRVNGETQDPRIVEDLGELSSPPVDGDTG